VVRDGNRIVTATGERKVMFTSAEDIPGFAFRTLLDEGRSGDYLILAEKLWSSTRYV
jgi:hypothetical protein